MSVEKVLEKLTIHNADVLGCVATHGERLHSNMPDKFELIDGGAIAERVHLMFAASDALETEHDPFDQVFMEYETHGLYARRLDDGVLCLITAPMQRGQFKKAQVGVNLFMKPLKSALAEAVAEPEPAKEDAEADKANSDKTDGSGKTVLGRMYRGVRY